MGSNAWAKQSKNSFESNCIKSGALYNEGAKPTLVTGGLNMMIVAWFSWFVIYSLVGWIYETVLFSIRERKFVNRGFLNGPICPVYGFGALVVLLALEGRIDNVFVLFVSAIILTGTLEYLTSVLLEKLFHAKWWDYSSRRFNLNGRVSLAAVAIFGVMAVLVIKYVHPFVRGMTSRLPPDVLFAAAAVVLAALAADTFFTVRHILVLNGRLHEIQSAINAFLEEQIKRAEELRDSLLESFEQSAFNTERIALLCRLSSFQNTRLVRAFPKMRSVKYEDAMKKLKKTLKH